MTKESPTKVMVKTSTTKNPYLKGGVTHWPMPEWYQKEQTEASVAMPTEASKVKQASESVAKNETNK